MPFAIAAIGAALVGGAASADAAGKASGAQEKSSKEAIAEQQRQYDQSRADSAQWRNTGASASARLGQLLGMQGQMDPNDPKFKEIYEAKLAPFIAPQSGLTVAENSVLSTDPATKEKQLAWIKDQATQEYIQKYGDPSSPEQGGGSLIRKFTLADFLSDPVTQASYQSGLDLGTQALNRSAGSRGNLNSGAQLKALLRFGTDYTGQQAAGSQARFVGDQTNTFNRFASLSGLGQTSAAQTGQLGQSSAQNIGQILTAQGNARGAAAIAQGNAWGAGANSAGNAYMQQQYMNKMFPAQPQGSNPYYTGYGANGDYQYG